MFFYVPLLSVRLCPHNTTVMRCLPCCCYAPAHERRRNADKSKLKKKSIKVQSENVLRRAPFIWKNAHLSPLALQSCKCIQLHDPGSKQSQESDGSDKVKVNSNHLRFDFLETKGTNYVLKLRFSLL